MRIGSTWMRHGISLWLTLLAGCSQSSEPPPGSEDGDSQEPAPPPDAGTPMTVDEAVMRTVDREAWLADVFCACPAFVDALEEVLEHSLDEETCSRTLSAPESQWSCLRRNFGSREPEAVPGLVCEMKARAQAVACVEPLRCGIDAAPRAKDCILALDERLDMCNLGSVAADDPPELIECFE